MTNEDWAVLVAVMFVGWVAFSILGWLFKPKKKERTGKWFFMADD